MTTHLTRAHWVTAARVPLHRWRTESRPCRHPRPTPVVHSPAYLAAFARFPNKRFIAVEKFERNVKDHLSMLLKLRFHDLWCSRNGIFVRAFVNILSFLGLRQAAQCQRLYSTPATDAPVLVFDRSGRPSSPSPPRPPTQTDRGTMGPQSDLARHQGSRRLVENGVRCMSNYSKLSTYHEYGNIFPMSCTVFALQEPEFRTLKQSLETSLRLTKSVD